MEGRDQQLYLDLKVWMRCFFLPWFAVIDGLVYSRVRLSYEGRCHSIQLRATSQALNFTLRYNGAQQAELGKQIEGLGET